MRKSAQTLLKSNRACFTAVRSYTQQRLILRGNFVKLQESSSCKWEARWKTVKSVRFHVPLIFREFRQKMVPLKWIIVLVTISGIFLPAKAKFRWPWESQSRNRGVPADQSATSGDENILSLVDDAVTEVVSDVVKTDPSGEDGGKLFLGMIKSYVEYQAAQEDKGLGTDDRPAAVFYGDLGYFYRNGSLSNLDRLPKSPGQIDTKFLLYTSPVQTAAEFLDYKDPATIQRSSFQPFLPTIIITHGFKTSTGTASLQWVMLYVDALFRRQGPGNYIVVDWSKGAQAPDYWSAAANTQLVGAQLAKLIEMLCRVKGTNPTTFQLIGFSLGSHVSGFAGKRLAAANVGRIGRIFAMDAAGPLFEGAQPGGRLARGDAGIVVAEHGSADGLTNGGLGIWQQIGDIDFYANGGKKQPGCGQGISKAIESILKLDFKSVPEAIQCNHNRNWLYVLQTFDPQCQFRSAACDTYNGPGQAGCLRAWPFPPDQSMGFYSQNAPTNTRMFFTTNSATPETTCGNHVKVTIVAAKASTAGRGNFSLIFGDANGVEHVPYVIAHDGRIPPGKQAFLLVRSMIAPALIKSIKILYQRLCQPGACFADTVNIQSVTLATVANDVIKTSCTSWDLVTDTWMALEMHERKCSKPSIFGQILSF